MNQIKVRTWDEKEGKFHYFDILEYMKVKGDVQEFVCPLSSAEKGMELFIQATDTNEVELYEGDIVIRNSYKDAEFSYPEQKLEITYYPEGACFALFKKGMYFEELLPHLENNRIVKLGDIHEGLAK